METCYEVIYLSKDTTNYIYNGNKIIKVTRQFLENNGYHRLYAGRHCKNCHIHTAFGKPFQKEITVKDKKPIGVVVCNEDIQK